MILAAKRAPMFSVVLPTFNRAHLLPRAIQSVNAQSFENWELVIVDDGSRDNTFDIVRPLALVDPRIRYHYAANRGLAGARNIGIQLSEGEWITFLDSDDEYLPNHLQTRAEYIHQHPAAEFLHGGVEVIGSDMVADKHDPRKMIAIADCVVGGTFFIRRSLLEKLGGFSDVEYSDDSEYFDRAVASETMIAKIDTPTYRYYRTESDSLCSIAERGGVEAIRKFRSGEKI